MKFSSFNIIFIYLYLSFIFHPNHGFEVTQPQNRTVNPDKTVSISCEHTAYINSVIDVRLNKVPPKNLSKTERSILCQLGMDNCGNIIMHKNNSAPFKYTFILLNIGSEAMNSEYECEVTAKEHDTDNTKRGTPTKLLKLQLQGQLVTPPLQCTPPPPPRLQSQVRWILIGLLALMFIYSCVITSFYMRLMNSSKNCENSTYVEMRNVSVQQNPFHIYNAVQKS